MKILSLLFLTALTSFPLARADEHHSHLPAGGRLGLHGMVLVGSGPYFLEHIPMLTPPHDFQILVEVSLSEASGKDLAEDFSQEGFTLKPSENFSLNDFITGKLHGFSGSIHRGNFEKGGRIIPGLEAVNIKVTKYKLVRQLPAESEESFIRFSDGRNTFESNLIRPADSQQRIRNLSLGLDLWCVVGPDFFEACR